LIFIFGILSVAGIIRGILWQGFKTQGEYTFVICISLITIFLIASHFFSKEARHNKKMVIKGNDRLQDYLNKKSND